MNATNEVRLQTPGQTGRMESHSIMITDDREKLSRFVYDALQDKREEEDGTYRPRPSSAGNCARALQFHRLGVGPTEPIGKPTLWTFEVGHALHEAYFDKLSKVGVILSREGPPLSMTFEAAGKQHTITGTPDAVVLLPGLGVVGVEVKTAHSFGIKKVIENREPDLSHYLQAQLYMHMSGIHRWRVVYINKLASKGSDDFVEFDLTYDREAVGLAVRKFTEVEEASENGSLIARPYDRAKDWQCRYCQWSTHCWDRPLQKDGRMEHA